MVFPVTPARRRARFKLGQLAYLQGAHVCSVVEDTGDVIVYVPIGQVGANPDARYSADAELFVNRRMSAEEWDALWMKNT